MTFTTPHGRAEVLGTRLSIATATESSRLEVHRGLVRFFSKDGERFVDVEEGRYSVATMTGGPSAPAFLAEVLPPRPPETPAEPTRPEVVWSHEFDSPEGVRRGSIVRYPDAGGVSAVRSEAFTSKSDDWKPDCWISVAPGSADGAPGQEVLLPGRGEFRLRIRAERPGEFTLNLGVGERRSADSYAGPRTPAGPEWREYTLPGEEIHRGGAPERAYPGGQRLDRVNLYGFGCGALYVDWVRLVEVPGPAF
jgi:hypothetical protein